MFILDPVDNEQCTEDQENKGADEVYDVWHHTESFQIIVFSSAFLDPYCPTTAVFGDSRYGQQLEKNKADSEREFHFYQDLITFKHIT